MYVKLENGTPSEWPVSGNRIKHENPRVSFPDDMSQIDVLPFGFEKFKYSDEPSFDAEYQNCDEITPVLTNGVYVQTWQVTDKYTAEERTAYDNQKEQDRISALPNLNRERRDELLFETDWWAVQDRTMTQAETDYRQALRDITSHANWPNLGDDDWPTKP